LLTQGRNYYTNPKTTKKPKNFNSKQKNNEHNDDERQRQGEIDADGVGDPDRS
jgi:hypothetical protein